MDCFDDMDDVIDDSYEDGHEDAENDSEFSESPDNNQSMEDWMYFGMALGLGQEIGMNEAEIQRNLNNASRPLLPEKCESLQTKPLLPVKYDFDWACEQIERMFDEYERGV